MREHAGEIPAKLKAVADNGVIVDGVHADVKFLGGGDSKLLNAWLGLSGGSSNHGCFSCETHKQYWHLSYEELKQHFRTDEYDEDPDPIPYRDTDKQLRLSHVPQATAYTCCCCGDTINPNDQPRQFRDDKQRQEWQRRHLGTMYHCEPFFSWMPVDRFIMDVLHAVLRVVPALFRHTVSSQLTQDQLDDVCALFSDESTVHISCSGAGQSARGSKEERNATECWSGEVCYAVMDNVGKLLSDTYLGQLNAQDDPMKMQKYEASQKVWNAFICLLACIHAGCDDEDDAAIQLHADEVESLAETFRQCFLKVATTGQVTVYMHHLWHHASNTIRKYGSLGKLSSQGTEAVHQVVKFVGRHRSDKKKEHVTCTVMRRIAAKQQCMNDPVVAQNKGKRTWRNMSELTFRKHEDAKMQAGAKYHDVNAEEFKRIRN